MSEEGAELKEHNEILRIIDNFHWINRQVDLEYEDSSATNKTTCLLQIAQVILAFSIANPGNRPLLEEFEDDVNGKDHKLKNEMKKYVFAGKEGLRTISNVRQALRIPIYFLSEILPGLYKYEVENGIESDFESEMPYQTYPITKDQEKDHKICVSLKEKTRSIRREFKNLTFPPSPQNTFNSRQFSMCILAMQSATNSIFEWEYQCIEESDVHMEDAIKIRIDFLNTLCGIRKGFKVPLEAFATLCPVYYASEAAALASRSENATSRAGRYQTARKRPSALRAPTLVRAKRVHLLPQKIRGGKKILPGRYLYLA